MKKLGILLCVIGFSVQAFPLLYFNVKHWRRVDRRRIGCIAAPGDRRSFSMATSSENSVWGSSSLNLLDHDKLTAEDLPFNLTASSIRSLPPPIRFKYRVRQLLEYKLKHGNYGITKDDSSGLDNWIRTQRYEYRMRAKGRDSLLTAERVDLLNKIGFDWQLDSQDGLTANWLKSYEALKEYYKQHGHVRLCASDGKLGKWVANMRYQYKRYIQGESPSSMTERRIELLEQVGMVWDYRAEGLTKHDDKWEMRYQELVEFQKQHGHCAVPGNSGSLGRWVSNQRKAYQNRLTYNISPLTKAREKLLRNVGFDFSCDGASAWQTALWEASYKELESFYNQHNHSLVKTCKSPLGNWVNRQRQEYRSLKEGKPSTMTQNRIELLEKLNFVWRVEEKSRKRMKKFERLKAICNDHADMDIANRLLMDDEIGPWIKRQRKLLEKAKRGEETTLTQEQMNLLQEVKIDEAPNRRRRMAWDARMEQLSEFNSKHGHALVTSKYDASLAGWVKQQRLQYRQLCNGKKTALTRERIEKLNDLGFEWNVPIGRPKTDKIPFSDH